MSEIILLLMNGVSYASILFIAASGFSLIFGLLNVVSMSHGCFYLIGCYIGYFAWQATGSWFLAIAAGAAGLGAFAYLFKLLLFNRVFGSGERESIMTLGMNIIIVDLLTWIFTSEAHVINAPTYFSGLITVGENFKYPVIRIVYFGFAVLVALVIWFLIKKTRLGQIIRAGVDDTSMVSALGIDISKVFTAVYVIGIALVGISSVLGATYMSFAVTRVEDTILLYSMIIVILGGMDSIVGAALGSLCVGLIDSFTKYYCASLSTTILFIFLILVMMVRPQGFLGTRKEAKK